MFVIPEFKYRALILFAIAFVATWIVFRPIHRIAVLKNIVDKPDSRKLQDFPIPVLGGIAVFFGIVAGLSFFKTMHAYTTLFPLVCAMVIMLSVGCMDDILDIKPWKRLALELIVGCLLIFGCRYCINNFQGMWGIGILTQYVSVPLTVLTFVGIVNAMNMIDGVDGLSSGFCILICSAFAVIFFLGRDWSFAALSVICVGALLPFFLHNVFGRSSKMYIGDGGTMMMGTIIATMVMSVLRKNFNFDYWPALAGVNRIALVTAVLALPVMDTLRVMTYRVIHGISPMHADRNHLHHVFIRLGFSHLRTTAIELALESVVIAAWAVSWLCGASLELQLYVVIAAMLVADVGTVKFIESQERKGSRIYRALVKAGSESHREQSGMWSGFQKFLDKDCK